MYLDKTTKSISFSCAEAMTTNPLDFSAHFVDNAGPVAKPQSTSGSSIGTTLVAAPGASTIRDIEEMTIYNSDTVSHKVTVVLNDGGVKNIIQATLAIAQTLYYNKRQQWAKFAL